MCLIGFDDDIISGFNGIFITLNLSTFILTQQDGMNFSDSHQINICRVIIMCVIGVSVKWSGVSY